MDPVTNANGWTFKPGEEKGESSSYINVYPIDNPLKFPCGIQKVVDAGPGATWGASGNPGCVDPITKGTRGFCIQRDYDRLKTYEDQQNSQRVAANAERLRKKAAYEAELQAKRDRVIAERELVAKPLRDFRNFASTRIQDPSLAVIELTRLLNTYKAS